MKQLQYHMITDRRLFRASLADVAAEVEAAGVEYFQLREKDLSLRELLSLAQQVRSILRRTLLIINGSLSVAMAANADGVHLQKDNIPVKAVRTRYKQLKIGYSAHSLEEMKEAEKDGADYVFISPIFQPLSKTIDRAPYGTSVLSLWTSEMNIPVFALGGISPQNLPELKRSGCAGAAGVSFFVDKGRFIFNRMVS